MNKLPQNNKVRVAVEVSSAQIDIERLNRDAPCAVRAHIHFYTKPGDVSSASTDHVVIIFKNEYHRDCAMFFMKDIFAEYKSMRPNVVAVAPLGVEVRLTFTRRDEFGNDFMDLRHFYFIRK